MSIPQETLLQPETLADLMQLADKADYMMNQVRRELLSPTMSKEAPHFTLSDLAAMCEVERSVISYRLNKDDSTLPKGKINASGNRREFSLLEALAWVRDLRAPFLKPAGAEAICIAIANFKGGVGKTTTTMTLAQGLSLRGHRVLVVDCDPQASLTTLFGILPVTEISYEDTLLPTFTGEAASASEAIRSSYWDGVDVVGAAPLLYGAEFQLPTRQRADPTFQFWDVLNVGLDEARQEYDVILIDTPPSLSYVTVNSIFAADALLLPLPPNALAVASLTSFWRLFSDICQTLVEKRGVTKEFDFVRILQTQVKLRGSAKTKGAVDDTVLAVKDWILKTYGSRVLSVEVPETKATEDSAANFGTVYDVAARENLDPRTYKRALAAYDQVAEAIEGLVRASWQRQMKSE
jgi:chromosome partitioning protein